MLKDLLENAFPIIEKIAPTIATVLGSPIAGAATNTALNLLKISFDAQSNHDLKDAILNHPDSENKLQTIEKAFQQNFRLPLPNRMEFNIKLDFDKN